MTIKIEKNIPLPKKAGVGRALTYPWDDMEPGDSFFVETDKSCPSAPQSARDKGWKFSNRRVENGFRIWRVE